MKRTYQAVQSPPRPHARLSGAHEDPWRPRHDQRPPRQGPQAPGRLSRLSAPAAPHCGVGHAPCRSARAKPTSSGCSRAARSRSAHFAVHHVHGWPSRARQAGLRASQRASYPQAMHRAVTLETLCDDPVLGQAGCGSGCVVPKRHARRAVTRSLLQAPDPCRDRCASNAARCRPGLWLVRLRAAVSTRQRFASRGVGRAAPGGCAPNWMRLLAPRPPLSAP